MKEGVSQRQILDENPGGTRMDSCTQQPPCLSCFAERLRLLSAGCQTQGRNIHCKLHAHQLAHSSATSSGKSRTGGRVPALPAEPHCWWQCRSARWAEMGHWAWGPANTTRFLSSHQFTNREIPMPLPLQLRLKNHLWNGRVCLLALRVFV